MNDSRVGMTPWLVLLVCLCGLLIPSHSALAAPTNEVEPNNTAETAQPLTAIGLDSPVNAEIAPAGERDWFKFSGAAGKTYVVELFNAARSLTARFGTGCYAGVREGLGLRIYDGQLGLLFDNCTPTGSGNVHHIATFKAGVDGTYYIHVIPNAAVTGTYSLRVLPKHDEAGAQWDASTLEPNNAAANAYQLNVGLSGTITTTVEEPISSYSTNVSDNDWFRFDATAGRTYVVEVFNVASALGVGSSRACDGYYSNSGLAVLIYDPSVTVVGGTCTPQGSGNVHNVVTFKAGLTGMFYVRILPNGSGFGTYSLRILPKYDESGEAGWDAQTFEPNNAASVAYRIQTGRANALTSTIEERNTSYSTSAADVDWYRFEAVAGQEYTVEILNVSPSLLVGSSREGACYSDGTRSGVGLLVYDSTVTRVAERCWPQGSGNVHNTLTVRTGLSGVYYILVQPNVGTNAGNYTLRVSSSSDTAADERRVYVPLVQR